MAKIAYEKKISPAGQVAYVGFAKKSAVTYYGKTINVLWAIRLNKEGGGYRVDKASYVGAWCPWEPVTDVTYPTVAAAKKAAAEFLNATT